MLSTKFKTSLAIITLSTVLLPGCGPSGNTGSANAQNVGGPTRPVVLTPMHNKAGKYFLNVPGLVTVPCGAGPVSVTFKIVGNTGVTFVADAAVAIHIEDPAGSFETPVRTSDTTVEVNDLCNDEDVFKYTISAVAPDGAPIYLDPLIKNE